MRSFIKPLAYALGIVATAFIPNAYAVTTYAYSIGLTTTAPKGSSSELASKEKTLPIGIKFSPCTASKLDQFAFTIKYDAGKTVDDMQSVYLVFNKPDSHNYGFYPLVRQPLTTTGAFFKVYNNSSDMIPTDTYTAAANNLGGAQTEIILGGSMSMETLGAGLWMITAIIAPEKTVNFDDPSTWSAWDTVPFMLRKPWLGSSRDAKSDSCE